MLLCPRCTKELAVERGAYGSVYPCGTCKGVAAMMPVLRKRLTPEIVNEVWQRARHAKRHAGRSCPQCHDTMAEVAIHQDDREVVIEGCERCLCFWFDFDELEVLPTLPPPPRTDSLSKAEVRERALRSARRERDPIEVVADGDSELSDWGGVMRITDVDPGEGRPWATWGVLAALLVTVVIEMADAVPRLGSIALLSSGFHRACEQFGFVPRDPWRHGGVTWISTFFVHAGWLHLIWNSIALGMLGDAFEPHVGWRRVLLLLALGAVSATFVHCVTHRGETIPVVGASGGIAGLFAWLAFRFPTANLRIPLGHDWFHRWGWGSFFRLNLRLRTAFLVWLGLELLYASLASPDGVAHSAHIGGAVAGLAAWWLGRQGSPEAPRA